MRLIIGIAGATLLATGAGAADRTSYRTIATGDFASAAHRLEAERRIHPHRPALMLNLAAAYRRLDRTADARALYQSVLARPAMMMDLPNGTVASSHDLAALGMARLASTTLAVR